MNLKFKLPNYLNKYKRFLIPIIFILLSVFMIFLIIIPQFSQISDLNNQVSAENDKVNTLQTSLNALSSMDDHDLETKKSIATDALPTTKDVSRIFSALAAAADASQTNLGDFSLDAGPVFGSALLNESKVQGTPSLEVTVRVEGSDASNLADFAKELQKTLPLSEVKKINSTDSSANYTVGFFYKPVDLSVISKQEKVTLPSQSTDALLNQMQTWENQ